MNGLLKNALVIAVLGSSFGAAVSPASEVVDDFVSVRDTNVGGTEYIFDHGVSASNQDRGMANNKRGNDEFSIRDRGEDGGGTFTYHFTIEPGAPDDALYIDAFGNIGLGVGSGGLFAPLTIAPDGDNNSYVSFPSGSANYLLGAGNDGFGVTDVGPFDGDCDACTTPFLIAPGAPNNAFTIDPSGNIGMGTPDPTEELHVVGDAGSTVLVENTDVAAVGDQLMFWLRNASSSKARFAISSNGTNTWTFDNNPATDSFSISKAGTGKNEFLVKSNGDGTFKGNSYAVNHINTSSRATKTDFSEIDSQDILSRLVSLPVFQWRYKAEDASERHIGPVAEDFKKVFSLGDGKTISTVDASGIALAAIQGVKQEKETEIAQLKAENVALKMELHQLIAEQDERMSQLEMALAEVQVSSAN